MVEVKMGFIIGKLKECGAGGAERSEKEYLCGSEFLPRLYQMLHVSPPSLTASNGFLSLYS